MSNTTFHLIAETRSDRLAAFRAVLEQLVAGTVVKTLEGFHGDGFVERADIRDLNRELLPAPRRVECRTRLRAEWSLHFVEDVSDRGT